jgi:hypothetical protein
MVLSTEQGDLEPNGWCQAHKKTWNLMDGAKHRVKTWYLMDGAEQHLMDGAKHSQQIKLYKLQE